MSFDKSLLQEWSWSERFAGQPETLRYVQRIAEKLDLRKDIQFNSRVAKASYLDDLGGWEVVLEGGEMTRARFLITAIGVLSTPVMPNIPGVEDYKGEAYHTAKFPHQGVTFEGKRVGVIGTGASGWSSSGIPRT
jgi:cation diffusion facilitator CzcD-associated flavoprotein CzcO